MVSMYLKTKSGKIILGTCLFLVALRMVMPYALKRYINLVLKDHIQGYTGEIADFDLSLYRGAYQMKKLVLFKIEKKIPIPFIDCEDIDFSIYWAPLLRGRVVGKVALNQLRVNFVNGPTKAQSQVGVEGNGWRKAVAGLFPLDIEHLRLKNSEIHFRDIYSKPQVDLSLLHVRGTATNLTNTQGIKKELVSTFNVESNIQNEGKLDSAGAFNLMVDPASVDLNLSMKHINLKEFNDFFKAYGNFDVGKGNMDCYIEMATARGKVKGYVKPLLTHVSLLAPKSRKDDTATGSDLLWSAANFLLRRYSEDEAATRIPFEGDIAKPKVQVWEAIKSLFGNAFGDAIPAGIDHSVNIRDAKKLLRRNSNPK